MSNHRCHRTLNRRGILKAAGLSLAMPAFETWVEHPCWQVARAADPELPTELSEKPKRFCCIFFPNGVSLPPEDHPDHAQWHWFPHQDGRDYRLTETLKPLESFRDSMSILSGLLHPAMRNSIAHITADSFLTGADSSRAYTNSISLDQLLAGHIGQATRFPSLTLSSDGGVGTPGRTQTLSFTASGRPIPSLAHPRAIFNRLFGVENLSSDEQRRRFGRDRSILDNVLAETSSLQRQLSAQDRRRLDEYTSSVRDIEQRLERADQWLDVQRPSIDPLDLSLDVSPRDNAEDYIRAILDLMYVALLTDSTRSLTYQITSEDAKGVGDRFPMSLGLSGHHSLTHDTGDEDGYRNWGKYDRFLASQLAYFLERLSKTEDPFQGGTLLDHTLVMYGCSTSRTHLAANYPLILSGGQSLGFSHGEHRRFDEQRVRLANLYVTILQQFGLPQDHFADSTGSLSEVLV